MLVRRQAHALEIVAGVARAGFRTAGFEQGACACRHRKNQRSTGGAGLVTDWAGYFWGTVAHSGGTAL